MDVHEGIRRHDKAAIRLAEFPVSAIARRSGRVSTGFSAFQALSRRQLYPINQEESPAGAGLLPAGYFAGATSFTGVPSALVFSPSLLAAFRSRSIRPARRSCTTCVSSAFFWSSKIL